MFYRVRASLHERPGALALIAARCGEAGLNILGLQIFPDLGRVTDELVINAPEGWTATAVADLVGGAGGDEVSVEPCTTHDLIDQPTRWLSAAQDVVADPELLEVVLERLLGPHPEKWTATEHSRAEALRSLAQGAGASGPRAADTVTYDEAGSGVLARIGGHVVGAASFAAAVTDSSGEDRGTTCHLTVEVAPAWRRLGVGTGLLTRAVTLAATRGTDEVVLVAPSGDEGFVPWLLHAGVRARMRSVDGMVQARVATAAGPAARVR